MYSSSAIIHLIEHSYKDSFLTLAKKLEIEPLEVMKIREGKQHLGLDNYIKLIHLYPELSGRVDYNGSYKP